MLRLSNPVSALKNLCALKIGAREEINTHKLTVYVNLLKYVKQEFQYFIKLRLLKIVLFPFHHYCHSPATGQEFVGHHSSHRLDVDHLQYQKYNVLNYALKITLLRLYLGASHG